MIRPLTDLGTDAPYGSSLRISRTVRYHSAGEPVRGDRRQVAQGAVSTGVAEGKFVSAAQKAKNRPAVEVIAGRFLC